jgi:hypothetical protein
METDPVSETSWFLVSKYRTMEKSKKPSNPVCYTPSSEPFRSLLTVVSATSAPPFQPLHQRNVCHPVVNRFMRQTLSTVNRNNLFMNVLCIESFAHKKKNAQQNAAFRPCTPQERSPFWLLKQASEHAHARLLPRLPWSQTVLLSSDNTCKTYYIHYSCFTSICDLNRI